MNDDLRVTFDPAGFAALVMKLRGVSASDTVSVALRDQQAVVYVKPDGSVEVKRGKKALMAFDEAGGV
jgi:hypothetical protein